MPFLKKIFILSAVVLLSLNSAFARTVTDAENTAFKASLYEYIVTLSKSDFENLIDITIPPSFYKQFEALANGASTDDIKTSLKASLKQLSNEMKISDLKVDENSIKSSELDNGEPFFIIPATAVITINNKKFNIKNEFVAVLEDGKWYFVDPSRPQQKAMLIKSFPGFDKTPIAPLVTEPVK